MPTPQADSPWRSFWMTATAVALGTFVGLSAFSTVAYSVGKAYVDQKVSEIQRHFSK